MSPCLVRRVMVVFVLLVMATPGCGEDSGSSGEPWQLGDGTRRDMSDQPRDVAQDISSEDSGARDASPDVLADQGAGTSTELDAPPDLMRDMTADVSPDLGPDMPERVLHGTPRALTKNASDGIQCGPRQCMAPNQCVFRVTAECRANLDAGPRVVLCDDAGDCQGDAVCCVRAGSTYTSTQCLPAAECLNNVQQAQPKSRACATDDECGSGACCDGSHWGNYGMSSFNVCQPTSCETCYFEPFAYCVHVDFEAAVLTGQSARSGRFFNANLANAELNNVNLTNAFFADGDLSNAQLQNVDLSYARLGGRFDANQFGSPLFTGVQAHNGTFVQLRADRLKAQDSVWSQSYFEGATLQYSDFTRAVFDGATFKGVSMYNSVMVDASFRAVVATDGIWSSCDFTRVDFTDATLTGMLWPRPDLTNASMVRADLTGTALLDPILNGVDWRGAVCPDGTRADDHDSTCEGHLAPKR